MSDVLFKVEHVSKSFPGTKVLDDINIDVKEGSVHAIVGENGAGKSTFMNIVFGVYPDYDGKLLWNGQELHFSSPMDAQKCGIAMVHQENSLIPYLSVMDNIYLGHYPKKSMFIDKSELKKRSEKLMEELKITNISPLEKVDALSAAQKQLVEIIKALSHDAKLLMLDEPTASLTTRETEHLLEIINTLREKGVAIIYVSHRLEEVFEISDEISVLRDGKMIVNLGRDEFDYDKVVEYMIGRKLENFGATDPEMVYEGEQSETIRVEHLSDKNLLKDISFSAKKGEILGFGGLVGAGRSELFEAIFGYTSFKEGKIFIDGAEVKIKNTSSAIKNGLALVPEERKTKGIFAGLSVMENVNVVSYADLKKGIFISRKKEVSSAQDYVEKLTIKTTSIKKLLGQLSGGNQQKVVLSRWLRVNPQILLLDEPTHGIDIGAKEDIYKFIRELAASGTTILLISSEMQELIRLSDRVIVMRNGCIEGILNRDELTQDSIMHYAMGLHKN